MLFTTMRGCSEARLDAGILLEIFICGYSGDEYRRSKIAFDGLDEAIASLAS